MRSFLGVGLAVALFAIVFATPVAAQPCDRAALERADASADYPTLRELVSACFRDSRMPDEIRGRAAVRFAEMLATGNQFDRNLGSAQGLARTALRFGSDEGVRRVVQEMLEGNTGPASAHWRVTHWLTGLSLPDSEEEDGFPCEAARIFLEHPELDEAPGYPSFTSQSLLTVREETLWSCPELGDALLALNGWRTESSGGEEELALLIFQAIRNIEPGNDADSNPSVALYETLSRMPGSRLGVVFFELVARGADLESEERLYLLMDEFESRAARFGQTEDPADIPALLAVMSQLTDLPLHANWDAYDAEDLAVIHMAMAAIRLTGHFIDSDYQDEPILVRLLGRDRLPREPEETVFATNVVTPAPDRVLSHLLKAYALGYGDAASAIGAVFESRGEPERALWWYLQGNNLFQSAFILARQPEFTSDLSFREEMARDGYWEECRSTENTPHCRSLRRALEEAAIPIRNE